MSFKSKVPKGPQTAFPQPSTEIYFLIFILSNVGVTGRLLESIPEICFVIIHLRCSTLWFLSIHF